MFRVGVLTFQKDMGYSKKEGGKDMDIWTRRTWAEIDLSALEHNYRVLRSLVPTGCRLLFPVKSDAYGHGALPIAQRLERLGADYLAVASMEEGAELRAGGITLPILVLGGTDPRWTEELIRYQLTQSVFDEATAVSFSEAAQRLGKRLKVHLKVDTGMTRLGFLCGTEALSDTADAVERIYALHGLEWEGIFTHFAKADQDESYTMLQFTRFLDLLDTLEKRGIKFEICHCAASAAVLNYPCTYLDMVRPGLAIYGHYPSPECEGLDGFGLVPVMTLKTCVISVKDVPAGTPVSYGCTHVLQENSRVAVLGIGYGDGLPRSCSDHLKVWWKGQELPILGTICMDLCMVDATQAPELRTGEEIEIFGPHIPVEAVAELAGTIQYEILCGINKRVPRIYL